MSSSISPEPGQSAVESPPRGRPAFGRTCLLLACAFGVPAGIVALWWSGVPARSTAPPVAPAATPPAGDAAVASGARVVEPVVAEPAPQAAPGSGTTPADSDAAAGGRVPGLHLLLEPQVDGAGGRHTGVARLLALTVPAGTPFAPGLPPGPFLATFTGDVDVDVRDRFTFVFEGSGELELRVGDKVALHGSAREDAPLVGNAVRLSKGKNSVVARYRSPALGDARVRVLWSTSEWKAEPIAPAALSHAGAGDAADARRARAEVERLQCTTCHAVPGVVPSASAPDLRAAGSRLHAGFVFEWLLRPLRRGAAPRQMPHFFADDAAGRQQAADVTAYLASLGSAPPAPAPGDSAAGGRSFAQLGCIGCHLRPGAGDDGDRLALDHVGTKWHGAALVDYLLAPHRVDPGASMPDFGLTPAEAADLAAFLLSGAAGGAPPPGDAARGLAAVVAAGCAACHALPLPSAVRAPAWPAIAGRIESHADLCGGAPRYQSVAGVALARATLGARSLAEAAEAAVAGLRCTACHARDGAPDAWTRHASEIADLLPATAHPEVDQARPSLTWAGEKLTPAWLRGLFTGAGQQRARPWLTARMPAFVPHAELLATGLACSHGVAIEPPSRTVDADLVAIGAALISAEKGFACVTCHGVGERPPTQVFEVQGVNFALAAARLRPEYYLRWMRGPQRIEPTSKMPRYADAQGKTAFTQFLGGDSDRQFAAIWAWLQSQ